MQSDSMDVYIRSMMSTLVTATKETTSASEIQGRKAISLLKTLVDVAQPERGLELHDDMAEDYLYDQIATVIDNLLESAESDINEVRDGQSVKDRIRQSLLLDKDRLLSQALDIEKPQLKFAHEVVNSRGVPFRPRLTKKYHGSFPLELREVKYEDTDDDVIMPSTYFPHPYEYEIRALEYLPWQLEDVSTAEPQAPSSDRPFAFIDKESDLVTLISQLRHERELAVDLEHHSLRSFQGFTCLMQVSTRHQDYIIDALELRGSMNLLLEVFADPNIVKVFHGCESDILWLQKDFGIYVVNCFDTFHAAKLLRYPALSFAHLVKYHCRVSLNKKYKLADWRLRPLTPEMIEYARNDTLYLLPVYDFMRKEVCRSHGVEGLVAILDATRQVCLKRYEVEPFFPLRYKRLVEGSRRSSRLTPSQDMVLAALFDWRDSTARKLDESVHYIMSNAELLRIGTMIPRSLEELKKCQPLSTVVWDNANEILQLINDRLSVQTSKSVPVRSLQRDTKPDLLIPVFDSSTRLPPSNEMKTDHSTVLSFIPSTPQRGVLGDKSRGFDVSASPVLSTQEVAYLLIVAQYRKYLKSR